MTLLRLPSGIVVNLDKIAVFCPLVDYGQTAEMQMVLSGPSSEDPTRLTSTVTLRNADAIALDATLRTSATPLSGPAQEAVEQWRDRQARRLANEPAPRLTVQGVRDDRPF